ncbi:hypothetical protein V5T82_16405 [Magnetovibrio sp. PR-2]|uniref:hypothetical protein n=1 Tax=Magnetovibrio sp. PR-2 TaxID=3120356 RepID=UPI002FCE4680
MFGSDVRKQLKVACKFFGGQKSVTDQAGIDNSNLGKWLNGKPTLSEKNVDAFLEALGLPSGLPDESHVHIWRVTTVTFKNYVPALKLYFPNGAQIAGAPWSQFGFQNPAKMFLPSKYNDNVFALTDGTVRAIIRLPRSILLQNENIGSLVTWRDGKRGKSVLDITEDDQAWVNGVPSLAEFDAAWRSTSTTLTAQDVLDVIKREGISFEEAIRRIQNRTS